MKLTMRVNLKISSKSLPGHFNHLPKIRYATLGCDLPEPCQAHALLPGRQVAFRHEVKELPLFGVAVVGMFVTGPLLGKDVEVCKATRRLDPRTSVPRPVALTRGDVENQSPPDRGGFMIP